MTTRLGVCALSILAGVCCWSLMGAWGSAVAVAKPAPLVTGINARAFLAALGTRSVQQERLSALGVLYSFAKSDDAGVTEMQLGVYPTVTDARDRLRKATLKLPYIPPDQVPKGIGDLLLWAITPGVKGGFTILRDNVICWVAWQGDTRKAADLARQIDHLLTSSQAICPRGRVVPLPNVRWDVPARVPAGATVRLRYEASEPVIREGMKRDPLGAGERAGEIPFTGRKARVHRWEIPFATQRDVVFKQTVSVRVVAP